MSVHISITISGSINCNRILSDTSLKEFSRIITKPGMLQIRLQLMLLDIDLSVCGRLRLSIDVIS